MLWRRLLLPGLELLWRWVLRPVLGALAAVWDFVVVRPLGFLNRRVLAPLNRAAAEVLNTVFGR
ncbi:hypothetical protein NLM24_32535 [Nocardia zapadnayensis]|uniref:hypothetical protein n=1 Tax=Nocardia rhamnosiphila TaxID=426716 RepID=UPI0022465F78|nr:hypothetical protein [Nocardia zapadnayensis]MCX0275320.1 hypothetical protein [Nocardia zapadnayensis]